jgi:hypothetical protein
MAPVGLAAKEGRAKMAFRRRRFKIAFLGW